jgi:hypothetical protein
MKRTYYLNLLITLLLIIFTGCNHSSNKKTQSNPDSSEIKGKLELDTNYGINSHNIMPNSKDDSIIKSISSTNANNIVNEDSIKPYGVVDSLVQLANRTLEPLYLKKLDSICSKSDGDLTEKLGIVCKRLFYKNTNKFIDFIFKTPNSCLQTRLMEALNEDYSNYDELEKRTRLTKDCKSLTDKAIADGLSNEKIEYIKLIFNEVTKQ